MNWPGPAITLFALTGYFSVSLRDINLKFKHKWVTGSRFFASNVEPKNLFDFEIEALLVKPNFFFSFFHTFMHIIYEQPNIFKT